MEAPFASYSTYVETDNFDDFCNFIIQLVHEHPFIISYCSGWLEYINGEDGVMKSINGDLLAEHHRIPPYIHTGIVVGYRWCEEMDNHVLIVRDSYNLSGETGGNYYILLNEDFEQYVLVNVIYCHPRFYERQEDEDDDEEEEEDDDDD